MQDSVAVEPVRLTSLAHGGGCGCKLAPGVLAELLAGVPAAGVADVLTDAVTLFPAHADLWVAKGSAERSLRHYDAAKESLGRALALNATHVDALNNLGVVLKASGDLTAAQATTLGAGELGGMTAASLVVAMIVGRLDRRMVVAAGLVLALVGHVLSISVHEYIPILLARNPCSE